MVTTVAMSGGGSNVRDASERDAQACAAIYAPYVTDTAITFNQRTIATGHNPPAEPR